jgi:hypothetical protein
MTLGLQVSQIAVEFVVSNARFNPPTPIGGIGFSLLPQPAILPLPDPGITCDPPRNDPQFQTTLC